MFERAKMRALPLVNQVGEATPMVTTCCNACRACWTSNLLGLAAAALGAVALGARRLARRVISAP